MPIHNMIQRCILVNVSVFLAVMSRTVITLRSSRSIIADLFDGTVHLEYNVTLKGERCRNTEHGDQLVYAFYGYKYGSAKRFEHSVLNTDFTYLLKQDHVKLGHACPQVPFRISGLEVFHSNVSTDEDCLYLDVYLPPITLGQNETWPVLFWIHEGGFSNGDKDMYNGSSLAEAINAIVVIINYRLNTFGFLSTGDDAAPGNWGLGDIKLALNWTLENIASFNGNPEKITISGQSAGGALVSALMLDDNIRARVMAAVAMSGSILDPWALREDSNAAVGLMARELGCPINVDISSAAAVECLRNQSADTLVATLLKLENQIRNFSPVIDGFHIRKDPVKILTDRRTELSTSASTGRVRMGTFITGFLTEDYAIFLIGTHYLHAVMDLTTIRTLISSVLRESGDTCENGRSQQLQRILEHYNLSATSSPNQLRRGYFNIATDKMFALGAAKESNLYAEDSSGGNQMYITSYDPGFHDLGAFHFTDVAHLFRGNLDVLLGGKMSDRFTESIRDFFRQVVHNGRFIGPSFGREGNYQELNQQTQWMLKRRDFTPLIDFWTAVSNMPCPESARWGFRPSH